MRRYIWQKPSESPKSVTFNFRKVESYTRAYENVYTDNDCRSGSGNEKHVRGMISKVNAAYEGRGLKSTHHNRCYGLVKPKTAFYIKYLRWGKIDPGIFLMFLLQLIIHCIC
ncbi:hypothetical protein TNIN_450001 [Trichonephila inaurata madagascariensis]|uniref:Uncharacterized protein n=1 Tax=Trichonephila inaurata madagascariensis TaxID=2747483 RepID=A0A8X7BVC7_9ARAC|nr:hypothetical protein TNIN_450001 [Trichonephila inaurata madagascariensis]